VAHSAASQVSVEIEPAIAAPMLEGRLHRIQLEARAGHACAVRTRCPDERAEQFGAGGVSSASSRSRACPSGTAARCCRPRCFLFALADVIGDVSRNLVRFAPDTGNGADINTLF